MPWSLPGQGTALPFTQLIGRPWGGSYFPKGGAFATHLANPILHPEVVYSTPQVSASGLCAWLYS